MNVRSGVLTSHSINAGNSRKGRLFEYRWLKLDMTTLTSFTNTDVYEALESDGVTKTGSYGVVKAITDVLTRFIQWRDPSDDRCWISEITISDDWVADVTIIKKIEIGRWKVTGNQLILYDSDGSTPLYTFDLKDSAGSATETNPYERTPV